MNEPISVQIKTLRQLLGSYDQLVVAFSGGVDSTYLLAEAAGVLGTGRVMAVTGVSPTLSQHELDECCQLAASLGVPHVLLAKQEDPAFWQNGPERCFLCKSALFKQIWVHLQSWPESARWSVVYGANQDDLADVRPGMKAAQHYQVAAPLLIAGMGKAAIREGSRRLSLPTADKPPMACLSSRFPTGMEITVARLQRVEQAEQGVRQAGLRWFRVRHHGELARLEVAQAELEQLADPQFCQEICAGIVAAGFSRVAIDPQGYRPGGANRVA